jgi:hypothetical protein
LQEKENNVKIWGVKSTYKKINDKDKSLEEIKNCFWNIMRWEHNAALCSYQKENIGC